MVKPELEAPALETPDIISLEEAEEAGAETAIEEDEELVDLGDDAAEIPCRYRWSSPSLEAWVQTDVKGWTLADMIDDGQYQTLLKAVREELGRFELSDGTVAFNSPAHIATVGGPS